MILRFRLRKLYGMEERLYYHETIESAQKCNDLKYEEMKEKAQLLKAKREEERLKLVNDKRVQQYM